MRPLLVALVAALGVILAGPALAGPAGIATAHSQLVSSSPGAGDVVPVAPTEIRLVFSEPLEGATRRSTCSIRSARRCSWASARSTRPTRHTLVAPVPALPNGSYTVNWRAVSASDGHATSAASSPSASEPARPAARARVRGTGGDIHSGHSGPAAIAEVEGKTVSYGGLMLVLGIAVLIAPVRARRAAIDRPVPPTRRGSC